jgi:glycosyltransferase involved in cell wall biosynthesis
LAIGLPFVYLPEVDVARIPGSLLVAPIHSGKGIPFDVDIDAIGDYVNYIKSIEHHFSKVIVIQHKGDLVNAQWFEQFDRVGIECITGADNEDANALLRIKMLFSQFDFVTTNGWGSHVAYALACGAKVSIVGAAPGHSIDAYLKDVGYGKDVGLIEEVLSIQTQEDEKRFLEKMYVSPENGVIDISLGEWFVGVENKKTPLELSTLFEWADCGQIASLNQTVAERDGQIASLNQTVAERDGQIAALYNSTSWRITRPLRIVVQQVKRIRRVAELAMTAIKRGGGLKNTVKKAIQLYRREGLAGIRRGFRIIATSGQTIPMLGSDKYDINDYVEWVRRYDTLTDESRTAMRARIDAFSHKPLISVVMPTYNPKPEWLIEAIESVRKQIYPQWELCIADDASTDKAIRLILERYAREDARIKVVFREQNGHISAASNSALELTTGEWVTLLDHDDFLGENALFWVADAIVDNPDAGLIYSDEDKIDQSGQRYDPYFKSDWNPDLFLSHNMISHLGAYRTDLVRKLGGFLEDYEGAQDYDLALRCIEQLAPQQIVHIPRVLYHWRSHPGSTALAGSEKNYALLAGQRALSDHFARTQVSAKVELLDFGMYRARYDIPAPQPLVSLIIPTCNSLSLIQRCIESILAKTTYKNYEILVVDNNSDDPKTLDYFASLAGDRRIRILRDERPFNFSTLNNAAVQQAKGEYLGLINNDIEVISPEWLDELISLAIQPSVGAVGARLWYPNDTLQHGGVITGLGGVAGHSHKHLKKGAPGFFFRAQLIQTFSAVTAACLVVKKSIYQEMGGLDEINLKVAFNDVDFCLRIREAGYRNVWTPYAELYHHESATRGHENTPEKQLRFRDEVLYMQKRWGNLLGNDPTYSSNLTLDQENYSYAWPPRVNPV